MKSVKIISDVEWKPAFGDQCMHLGELLVFGILWIGAIDEVFQ